MSERDIQAAVLAAFSGNTQVRLWRSNAGTARSRDGNRFVRFGVPGQADLSGLLADGRRLEIEIKTPTGRQSPQQVAFGAMITKFGGLYVVARSAADAVAAVDALVRGIHDADSVRCAARGTEENDGGV